MENEKSHILIIEDDIGIAEMLDAYFRVQDYQVSIAHWGEDGIKICQDEQPDIVILDIQLPDIDGFKVAMILRTNQRTKNIPFIFLTEKKARDDRLQGLELQADDYITKPFDIQELRLRVRNAIERSVRGPLTNPVTGLAEGRLVDQSLKETIPSSDATIMVMSLINTDKFRDIYGYTALDDLLRAVALMIQDSISLLGTTDDFLGHLSAVDFLMITKATDLDPFKDRIKNRLEKAFEYLTPSRQRSSDLFEGKILAVHISEIMLKSQRFATFDRLKVELEHLINR